MATKLSILFFYLSLFGSFKNLKLCAWITILVVGIGGSVLTILILFQCRPVKFITSPADSSIMSNGIPAIQVSAAFSAQYPRPSGTRCLNTVTILYASAPLNITTDLAILLLPMPALTALNLPKKEKIIVVCLFAGGGLSVNKALRL